MGNTAAILVIQILRFLRKNEENSLPLIRVIVGSISVASIGTEHNWIIRFNFSLSLPGACLSMRDSTLQHQVAGMYLEPSPGFYQAVAIRFWLGQLDLRICDSDQLHFYGIWTQFALFVEVSGSIACGVFVLSYFHLPLMVVAFALAPKELVLSFLALLAFSLHNG